VADPAGSLSADCADIVVIAGVNGAGKSSIAGAALRERGGEYFNPDEHARRYLDAFPNSRKVEANSYAWQKGKAALEAAIDDGTTFVFETTLGGRTITEILIAGATRKGAVLRVWYAGLESVELHIQRVASRVSKGGHDIDEEVIRGRYAASHANMVRLLPHLAELKAYDNSVEADPAAGARPNPRLVLAFDRDGITWPTNSSLASTPAWAKPLVMAAIKRFGGSLPE
jgi:predicted ABC-type ATPase